MSDGKSGSIRVKANKSISRLMKRIHKVLFSSEFGFSESSSIELLLTL